MLFYVQLNFLNIPIFYTFLQGTLSCIILSVSGAEDKSSDTLRAILSFPTNVQDLEEVSSLEVNPARTYPRSPAYPNPAVQPPLHVELPQAEIIQDDLWAELEQPLMPDHERRLELENRLYSHS